NTDKTKQLDEATTRELLGIDELYKVYKGRDTSFIIYWPNEKTFMNPLGVSCLKGQDGKQDEINWTLTRNAITFERNGKPRIAVSKEIMQALEQKAVNRYGDSSRIDHRDLEVMTMDEDGNAMEIIQIDISRIGDIQWVKDLMKLMLMETKTSEKAIDFYLNDNAGGHAESVVAKFYDLFTSIIKSEQIQQEYIYFIKQLFKSALWLANYADDSIEIEEPDIDTKAMIPISKKELTEQNAEAFDADIQSLETTVRRNNPTASEEWIQEENIYFIKQLFKSKLWLANYAEDSIEIEEPDIDTKAMIPISKKELTEQNAEAFDADIQSLETTVRRNNPTASEEWIQEEMER